MAKYVIMFETDEFPDVGNCDYCKLHCSDYMSTSDKQRIIDHGNIRYICLNDFYCPIRAVIDIEAFKKEHPDLEEFNGLE